MMLTRVLNNAMLVAQTATEVHANISMSGEQ